MRSNCVEKRQREGKGLNAPSLAAAHFKTATVKTARLVGGRCDRVVISVNSIREATPPNIPERGTVSFDGSHGRSKIQFPMVVCERKSFMGLLCCWI